MKEFSVKSDDGYILRGNICEPVGDFEYIIYLVHGMCEHKERYYEFMNFLALHGYCAIICDLRGHGKGVSKERLGYFGQKDALVDDLANVVKYLKEMYKDKKIVLFGHSMGSLIVRNYIQDNDNEIDKMILCGPPTKNNLAVVGSYLCNLMSLFRGKYYRSKLMYDLTLGSYNKGYEEDNEWLVNDKEVLREYNDDEYCGFTFTLNGYESLFYMLRNSFNNNYKINNENMPILLLAGSEDRVVGSSKKFLNLYKFLKENGYNNIDLEEYDGMKHELLDDVNHEQVYQKVLSFIKK